MRPELQFIADQKAAERVRILKRVRALHAEGLSIPVIHQRLGLSTHTVGVMLKEMGLSFHQDRDGLSLLVRRKWKRWPKRS